jgi:hypothetical protein
MWPTLVTLWLALSGGAPPRPAPRRCPAFRRPSYRPRLEALEGRAVPASLSYSTFLNGIVYASAVDNAGNVYVTGNSSTLATTPGAFETSGSGAFVAKLNPTGTGVLYATYLGNGGGAGTGIAVDSAGDAYVIGTNPNVPTTPNAIASSGSGQDFVAELNPSGSGLFYSTYLPGTIGPTSGAIRTFGNSGAIAVDGSGNIYVAGAAVAGFPVTANAFQTAYLGGSGGNNAFFAQINPTLSGTASLLYATYLGGSGGLGDQASGIALDGAGNAYVTGFTSSTNFPTTGGAFQRAYGGGGDAFVAKFNPALSGAASLVYSTYLGGSGADGFMASGGALTAPQTNGGIAVDSAGNAYVTGSTASINFPTTPGAFQVKSSFSKNGFLAGYPSPSDVFVTKLNATGTALVYSTYLGRGSKASSGGTSIAVDSSGDRAAAGGDQDSQAGAVGPARIAAAGACLRLGPGRSRALAGAAAGGAGPRRGRGCCRRGPSRPGGRVADLARSGRGVR